MLTTDRFSLRWMETSEPQMISPKTKKQHFPTYSLPPLKVLHSKAPLRQKNYSLPILLGGGRHAIHI